jgi:hypothetical protein
MTKSKLCLIDSRITNSDIFMENVNSDTVSILIDYKVDTFDSLFNKIKDLQLTSIDSIAYVAHGTFQPTYSFLKNEDTFDMDKKESWKPLFDFLLKFNGLKYFDFLGCNLASNVAWKQVFNWIEESKGINVRASTDATGNLVSGGNWILEDGSDSVSVDAKKLYFTNLDSFEGLLLNIIFVDGIYTYTITSGNTVELKDCSTKSLITSVTIPTTVTLNDTNRSILDSTILNGEYNVTSIGVSAFKDCVALTSLIIPDTVTSIKDFAFIRCRKLNLLTLSKNLTSIGVEAFISCIKLESLILPNNLMTIGKSAFAGCSVLKSLIIPDSLTTIENFAFQNCIALESLTLSDNLKSIGDYAFQNCWVLASLTLPKNLTSIGTEAFAGCKVLTSLILPNTLTSIGFKAFQGCTGLTSIIIPPNIILINFIKDPTNTINTNNAFLKQTAGQVVAYHSYNFIPSNSPNTDSSDLTFIPIDSKAVITSLPNGSQFKIATAITNSPNLVTNVTYTVLQPVSNVVTIPANVDYIYVPFEKDTPVKIITDNNTPNSPNYWYYSSSDNNIYKINNPNIIFSSPLDPLDPLDPLEWSLVTTIIINGKERFLFGGSVITGNEVPVTDPNACFNENTKILCLKNDIEEYVLVQDLKKGDLVKTYSNLNSLDYKKIVLIGKRQFINNPDIWSKCMYKMGDLIVTGGHSILVDELSEEDKEKEELLNRQEMVDDKRLVWAGLSHLFTKLDDKNKYTYYHFVLEDEETEDNTLYGVWANGVLVETIKRKDFFAYGLKDV